EMDTVHVPDFALVPVGVRPDGSDGGDVEIVLLERDLDHHIAVTLQRHQVVEHAEIGRWQALAMGAQALMHAMPVIQHHVGLRQLPQELQYRDQLLAGHPEDGHAGPGGLDSESGCAEVGGQLGDNPRVVSLVWRYVQRMVCSHHMRRYRSSVRYVEVLGLYAP